MIISTFALKLCDVGRRKVKAQGSTKTSNNVHWGTEHAYICTYPYHHLPNVAHMRCWPPVHPYRRPRRCLRLLFPSSGCPIFPDPRSWTQTCPPATASPFPRPPGSRGIAFNLKLLAWQFASGATSKNVSSSQNHSHLLLLLSPVFIPATSSGASYSRERPRWVPLRFLQVSSRLNAQSRGRKMVTDPRTRPPRWLWLNGIGKSHISSSKPITIATESRKGRVDWVDKCRRFPRICLKKLPN